MIGRHAPHSTDAPQVILDCDPGLDDAIAIALALRWSDVVGISTVGGNVSLERTTANALALCDLLGRSDVPVHAGHDTPLSGSLEHRATEYHGPFGTGSVRLDAPTRPATSDDAVTWLIATIRSHPNLWLIATGPLTNIARAIQQDPGIVGELAGIAWMGGSSGAGNTTAAAEFNAWVDPEAAAIVLGCGHPRIVMLGLHVTHTVLLDHLWISELRDSIVGSPMEVFADLLAYYEQRQRSITTLAGAAVHDALAVLAVTHPEVMAGVGRTVQVITHDGPARGMTLVDQRPRRIPDPPNVEVIEWVDAARIRAIIRENCSSRLCNAVTGQRTRGARPGQRPRRACRGRVVAPPRGDPASGGRRHELRAGAMGGKGSREKISSTGTSK
jgi:inosine-uridine nucleoside N-ribohydrolase